MEAESTLPTISERMRWEAIKEDGEDAYELEISEEEELEEGNISLSYSTCIEDSIRLENSLDSFARENNLEKCSVLFKLCCSVYIKKRDFIFKRDKDFDFVKGQLQEASTIKEEFKSIEETVMTNHNPFAFIKENILFLGDENKKNKMWESANQVVTSYFFQLLFYRSKNFKTGGLEELHELKEMINSLKNINSNAGTEQAKKLKMNKTAQPDFYSTFNVDGESNHWLVSLVVEFQRKGLKPNQDHKDT
ncbi:hypothetical protein C9374_012840 [Naegleria lovaniensis]|uniref:Uncharacterized protein n=1 Tax=Naegleria lovaniensis TaxID=51637 RepID=A0AA88GE12_NAELO|nr:uncharacterized protein C9374_012840 [Naegleria lovaniensis]KAG2373108.1 hypothetical protein C9374_012840 [Naegleria lovaniensis]